MVKCFSAFLLFFKCTKPEEEVLDWQHTYVTTPDSQQTPSVATGPDLVTDVSTNNTFDESPPDVEVTTPDETTVPVEVTLPVEDTVSTQVEHHAGMPTASQVQMREKAHSRGLRRA